MVTAKLIGLLSLRSSTISSIVTLASSLLMTASKYSMKTPLELTSVGNVFGIIRGISAQGSCTEAVIQLLLSASHDVSSGQATVNKRGTDTVLYWSETMTDKLCGPGVRSRLSSRLLCPTVESIVTQIPLRFTEVKLRVPISPPVVNR